MSVSPDISVVSGTRITLSASCTDCISYSWSTNYGNYGSLNGGSIKVVPIDSTIYYVSGSNNYNCSISDSIIVSINYYMPNITGLCDVPYGSNTTLTASGIGPFTWYNDQYQGVLLHTGSSFTTPNLYSDTKFWVSDNGGPRKQVSVSITYGVTSISASLDTICGNNYSFLSANVQSGYVNWYTNATGGSPFITSFSGNSIAVLPIRLLHILRKQIDKNLVRHLIIQVEYKHLLCLIVCIVCELMLLVQAMFLIIHPEREVEYNQQFLLIQEKFYIYT